jgi:hypothetical protein
VAALLASCGYQVTGFDLADGADVLDLAAVRRAARGCSAIVHLAALAHDSALIDCSAAATTLGWQPAHHWSRQPRQSTGPR